MRFSTVAAVAVLPVVVAVVGACGGDDPGRVARGAGTAVVTVNLGEPVSLVPPNIEEVEGGQVASTIFAGLLGVDSAGRPAPLVADSVTSTDSRVWTIKLRSGFTFHNGEPVTARSFIDAWNWGAYGPHASNANSYFEQIDGYAAMNPAAAGATPTAKTLSGLQRIDDLTFTVTLSRPFVDFDLELTAVAFDPLPTVAFNPDGTITKAYQEAPIGNGPFRMNGGWRHDQSIEVARYPGWKGVPPKVAGIRFRIYQDPAAQYADVLSGTLDVDRRVDVSNLGNARADFGSRHRTSPLSAIQYLGFPLYDQRFANRDVRRAISMAIDRDQITSTIFAGTAKPARSFLSPVLPAYRDGVCGEACALRPQQARALYQAAGGPSTIQITYNVDGGHKTWIEAVCNQIHANLGVTCQAKGEPKFADLLQKLRDKDPTVGMFRLGWVMPYPSMYAYLFPLYDTASIPSPNFTGYSNARFDELVRQGATATDPQQATRLWQQAEDLLAEDLPVLPMRYDQNVFVVSRRITHVDVNQRSWVDPYTLAAG